jgi:hypothetical protein
MIWLRLLALDDCTFGTNSILWEIRNVYNILVENCMVETALETEV